MDTSNSSAQNPLHFITRDLMQSRFEEETASAEKFREALWQLIEKLLPVMKYVSRPEQFKASSTVRCISLGMLDEYPKELYLSEAGKFFSVYRKPRANNDGEVVTVLDVCADSAISNGNPDWELMYFDRLIGGLQIAFQQAIAKKKAHLESLESRGNMLGEIMAVINAADQPKQPTA